MEHHSFSSGEKQMRIQQNGTNLVFRFNEKKSEPEKEFIFELDKEGIDSLKDFISRKFEK